MKSITEIFSDIYKNNTWGNGSGPGSTPEATAEYQQLLKTIIADNNIKTVLDYGCGDWQFSKYLGWDSLVEQYIGVDVVPSLIKHHTTEFSKENVNFELVDENFKWTPVDLIVCKDVLQHLPTEVVSEIIKNMKAHSKFILLTNDISGAKSERKLNQDCGPGGWRPLDFSTDPWNIPCKKLLTWQVRNRIKQTILIKNYD